MSLSSAPQCSSSNFTSLVLTRPLLLLIDTALSLIVALISLSSLQICVDIYLGLYISISLAISRPSSLLFCIYTYIFDQTISFQVSTCLSIHLCIYLHCTSIFPASCVSIYLSIYIDIYFYTLSLPMYLLVHVLCRCSSMDHSGFISMTSLPAVYA